MKKNTLTLIKKIQLTHDVYELTYTSNEPIEIQPGQFLLCDCEADNPKYKRSYSVSYADKNMVQLVIKRLENGTGGSIAICNQEIGHQMSTMGPMGHFVLQNNQLPKVFIGTGTGFAPLYFQILEQTKRPVPMYFIFGVRNEQDIFYTSILDKLTHDRLDFSYQICLSQPRQTDKNIYHGYVTQKLREDFASLSESEFYICGSPSMVSDVREYLE